VTGTTGARGGGAGGRDRILARIREALRPREVVEHPGPFTGWRSAADPPRADAARAEGPSRLGATRERHPDALDATIGSFEELFRRAGGETARVSDARAAAGWMASFATDFPSMTVGRGVPDTLHPALPTVSPSEAALGISMACGAVAETGSLLLDARDGRRTQLLAPTHLVLVPAATVYATLVEAFAALRHDLPSAVGLHSGPSKSADIGQVMVRGVHGPGRVVAIVADRLD
jgi:L-lactate dehydrogenase complex protein LldG